ncbi:unnamed protein product [Gemmata massiliana]|uniref:Uncharacterized protein n=1 Tax=Gemmata massiliana TaxID=1210884 RepID=A0A6P2DLZ7_9BACT|nr:hypothetical protein [Gemmata massiliana]VTS03548.1 unnamed protein product [Gemmata massiliana]
MSVTRATVGIKLDVVEVPPANAAFLDSSKNSLTFNKLSSEVGLTGSGTPNVTAHANGSKALTAGAGSLDLTALVGINGAAVSLDGLKPRAILFENPATNANPITIAKGAANGYTGLGAAFSHVLQPGQKVLFNLAAAGTAVSSTVKVFDLTGTGTQALNYQIVAGT